MAIDPTIALGVKPVNLSDILNDVQQRNFRQAQMDEWTRKAQQERESGSALSALISTRKPDGSYDTQGPAFARYAQADPKQAFEVLKTMDENKRKSVEAGVKDMAAAVQWADTPEKWQVVQRHYGQYDPQLAAVPFENRQQALISLGQMGEYLKNTAPELKSVEPGGGLYSVNKDGSGFKVVVAPNDGSQSLGQPVSGNAPSGSGIATKNVGGKTYYGVGGKWFDNEAEARGAGGQTASPSGPFRQ